jgi:hypothetical protein
MAGVKISALPAIPVAPQLTDIFAEVQPASGGTTYKTTFQQLLTLFNSNIQIAESQVTNLVTDLASKLSLSGGTMTGNINMGTHLITNLGAPVASTDASTKAYADTKLALAGGTMSGAIDMGSNYIHNVLDPTSPQDAATKNYVDTVATGLNVQPAVYAGTTANLNATYANGAAGIGATLTNAGALAAFSIDGVSPPLNSRVLVKNQTTDFQNGIYTLTTVGSGAVAWILTRATDYDQPSEINPGDLVLVNNGTANAGTAWVETMTVTTIGTDPVDFSLLGGNIYALKGANSDITSLSGLTGGISTPTFMTMANGGSIRTNTGAGNTLIFQAYDVDGASYTTFATLTANNTPTFDLASGVTIGGSAIARGGANTNITSMTGLTGTLQAPTGITDSSGNLLIAFNYQPTPTGYIDVKNSSTSPALSSLGSGSAYPLTFSAKNSYFQFYDNTNTIGANIRWYNAAQSHFTALKVADGQATDVTFTLPAVDGSANFVMKTNGSGALSFTNGSQIAGTATNDDASAGNIGEYMSSVIPAASGVSISTTTATNMTTLSLTAGDWDVYGNITFTAASGTPITSAYCWLSTTSASLPDTGLIGGWDSTAGSTARGMTAPFLRVSVSSTTTVYISGLVVFGSSTVKMTGGIFARRRR